ncbi:hypothetical protein L207DRAFT_582059 [Hyaloscypha variabilis F]|uniref:Uncharacterized protein n=1 Tax=Hyaloscypha variabilis (strain UAMH 11265 / GT02V1 / F) TaxID=1149755 RepID=A0A2J6RSZ0_HYAVF|nr:hypothetical protein L207DRAFT_582059 [Hyaloscypha variabilis F]
MEEQQARVIYLWCECGHVDLSLDAALNPPRSPIPYHTCQDQPHFIFLLENMTCRACLNGDAQPLTGEALEQVIERWRALSVEEDGYRRGVNERNEPLEKSLCSILPHMLNIPEARQLLNLRFQLNHIILPSRFRLIDEDYAAMRQRQERLKRALFVMPLTLMDQLSLDECLDYFLFLHQFFYDVITSYSFSTPEIRDHFRHTCFTLGERVEAHLQPLKNSFNLLAAADVLEADIRQKWANVQEIFSNSKALFRELAPGPIAEFMK